LGLFTVIDSVYRGYLDYAVRKNESKD